MTSILEYEVDGTVIRSDDDLIDGRHVRITANLSPASDFVLVRIDEGIAQSFGLEDRIQLAEGVRPVFRSFESGEINTFTVDERGWEWGADEIAEADVRAIGSISDNHDLFLDSDGDRAIPRGGLVRLSRDGVERIRSRKAPSRLVPIVVNTRRREVEPGDISFEELLALAFPVPPTGPQVSFTVSYRKGPASKPEGSLLPGQSVNIVKGMTFNVTATDKS